MEEELLPRHKYWTVLYAADYMIIPDSAEHIYLTEEDAINYAVEEAADEIGVDFYVYECRPIKRVRQRKVNVEDVEEES